MPHRRPRPLPRPGTVFNTQSRSEFDANWDRQVGCENQVDPKVREVVWAEMIASDPVGAKWGTGVRRAPSTTTWGFNKAMIGGMKTPTLMIAAAHRQAGARPSASAPPTTISAPPTRS